MARNRSETPPTKFEVKSPPCRSSLVSGSVPPAANEYGSPPLPPDVATMSRSPSPNPPKNKSEEEEEEEEEEESAPSRSGGLMLRNLPGWGKGILSCFHGKMRPPIDEAAFGRGPMGKGMLACSPGKMRPPIDEVASGRAPMGKGILSSFHGKTRPPIDEAAFGCGPMAEYIEKYYLAASERLPLEEIPDLVGCINAGGFCVGLADPVTNIILNAIALLQQQPSPPSQPPTTPPSQKTKKMYRWFPIATKSYESLCAFMTAYFNYLSRTQAQRYLYLACQDLALAINLVHYDRFPSYSQEQQRCLLPDGGQIKAALRAAALQARHPEPDVLAGLMTAQYPAHLLSPILATLQNNNNMLTPINVWEIKDLLAHQWPRYPSPTNIGFRCRPDGITCTRRMNGGWLIEDRLDEGIVACISISRAEPSQHQLYLSQLTFQDEGIDARLSSCLVGPVIARLQEQHDEIEVNYDDHPCEHILSLRMCLLKTIHSFYIKALAKLPSTTRSARLFRALLVAGHCYGPMDPVSNIILSTTWYDIAFGADVGIPQGIFSTTPLSRMVSRSLDGLVAISSLNTCESEHEALYNINTLGCDLSTYLFDTANDESLSSTQETAVSNTVLFAAAAKAAKHPQHEAFVSFVKSLSAKKLIFLRHLLSKPSSRILSHDWDKLNSFLRSVMPFSTRNDMDAPLTLFSFASLEMFHPSASLVMPPSASQIMSRDKQAIVCTELNKMLDEYCYQHPWEPSYKLDVVCGVMQSSRCAYYGNSTLYHANFLASSDDGTCTSSQTEATLFFAEFWEPSLSKAVQLNPSSCRPIKNHLYTGRCSICEGKVSMIIHPPCGGHSGDIKGSIDIYPGAAESVLTLSSADLFGSDMYYDPDIYFPPPIGNDSPVIASTPTAQPSTSMAQPSLRKKRQRGNGVEVVDAKPSFSSSKNFLKNSDYDTS